jgi:hypothetical protein
MTTPAVHASPGGRGVEPGPVVGDGELQAAIGAGQADLCAGRARVLRDVLQRLQVQKYTAASASCGYRPMPSASIWTGSGALRA